MLNIRLDMRLSQDVKTKVTIQRVKTLRVTNTKAIDI